MRRFGLAAGRGCSGPWWAEGWLMVHSRAVVSLRFRCYGTDELSAFM